MDHKLSSSRRTGGLSSSGSDSDPEREFSGDDDDRNHKHRRREIRSQSSEFDASQSVSSRPFSKRNKPFDNGHPFRGNGSRNGGWRNGTFAPSESDRHFELPMLSRPQMDVNQRIGLGQTYFGDSGFARGRGRESWNQHAPRFGSMEFPHAAHQGSASTNLFVGRGLPNVAGVPNAPWHPYGLLPGMPSGGLDAMHSLRVNSALRPPINPPNTGMIHKKCRDFEERGFCLRGDMCPMEHGVNRIVVDDVQSLSKFNLPVSLSGGNTLGVGGGSGPLPAGTASTSLSANSTKFQRKMGKSKHARRVANSDAGCTGTFSCFTAAGNDFYDPDQPLLNKSGPDTSTAPSQPCSQEIQQAGFDGDPSSATPGEVHNGSAIHPLCGKAGSSVSTHNLTLPSLGNIHGFNSRPDLKGKVSMVPNLSGHNDYTRGKEDSSDKIQATSVQGIHVLSEDNDTIFLDASQRRLKGSFRNTQKPQPKAMRTIFVDGIPQKNNNKEALISHFQKFGEIIDIYIPLSSEKAFVQFSTREEAEAALKAPDAVMGNRFIKLWWANRDNIPDPGVSIGTYSGSTQVSVGSKGKSNQLPAPKSNVTPAPSTTSKVNVVPVSSNPFTVSAQSKHVSTTGLASLAPSQKKLENLEVLKEELRKKQELLDQKRNEFKRQLDRLEKQKQSAGLKGELSLEQPAKRHKGIMATDVVEGSTLHSADISTSVTLSRAEELAEKTQPVEKLLVHDPSSAETLLSLKPTSLKMLAQSTANENVRMNRSKIDNQPKAFMIVPPLRSDFANIVTLREHFSPYGEVSEVELVNIDTDECPAALIRFNTQLSADKAFQSGQCWKGHDLQFTWVTGDISEHKTFSSSAEEDMDVDIASQNNLQEDAQQPDENLKAALTNITDKVAAPDEKPSPCKETLEGQLFEDDADKVNNIQPDNENVVEHENKLSEEDEYAEKTDKEKSSDEDSVKSPEEQSSDEYTERAHGEQPSEDNVGWTHEKQLSDREVQTTSHEEHPSYLPVDSTNEEHSIEECEEKTFEDQLSEDDIM
ncbi:unnamed protein product [Rhodiola kirilowii]